MTATKDQATALAEKTSDCYSWDRYAHWPAVCQMLLRRGFSELQAEAILRSKWTRWAGDASSNDYGRCSSKDLARFLDTMPDLQNEVRKLTAETFPNAEGEAYATPIECGTRKAGYYTAFMVYQHGTARPHTGPLATREEADALVAKLNAQS